jgi:hypothetical protein
MKYIIQIHLEHKNDVIRDIEIPSEKSLKDLHYTIIDCLNLEKNEMASFYMTNEDFELLQEIPLFKIGDKDSLMLDMSEVTIASVFPNIDSQLIYVYDFLKMWRFLVSYSKETENESETIKIVNSIGEMPKEAPGIIFEVEKKLDSYEETDKEIDEFYESEY